MRFKCIWRLCTAGPFAQHIPQDEGGAPRDQDAQDEQGVVAEHLLGEDVDDLVGAGVKKPVVLAGEKDGVEEGEGPVEIQGGQAADDQKGAPQPCARPEAGAPPQ